MSAKDKIRNRHVAVHQSELRIGFRVRALLGRTTIEMGFAEVSCDDFTTMSQLRCLQQHRRFHFIKAVGLAASHAELVSGYSGTIISNRGMRVNTLRPSASTPR